ncbi:rhomboid family intramembrane serine protease [Cellulomonas humilata]|uniref:Rhomboid family intramembrane serine protease n=1 Tax=Cellulomonas humilata TaxID=144055 RepID=A0A7Y6A500_9CELL|nr:rhomboid family intramembrane serine protease [Cellulomonas humilata]
MSTSPDPGAPVAPPVCPRHPDRVSYVRCQRCGRPTCPECQRQAAVGVHCVDCVAEAARAVPSTRTALGGVRHDGRPVVTLTLIGLCVASFVLQLVLPSWTARWLFSPILGFYEPWRFLTAAFLHSPGQYVHIAFNMLALWFVGPTLENTLGRARYLTLYLVSAVGGSVGSVLLATATDSWATSSVGASGAVFGLFGAILVVSKRLGGDVRGILVLIGINLALGFVMANIAWQAHVGGLLTGGLLAAAYAYAPPARRRLVAVAAPVTLCAVLLVATLLAYASVGAFG